MSIVHPSLGRRTKRGVGAAVFPCNSLIVHFKRCSLVFFWCPSLGRRTRRGVGAAVFPCNSPDKRGNQYEWCRDTPEYLNSWKIKRLDNIELSYNSYLMTFKAECIGLLGHFNYVFARKSKQRLANVTFWPKISAFLVKFLIIDLKAKINFLLLS